jgi:membrane protein YdbS with pleckstrin-like domain
MDNASYKISFLSLVVRKTGLFTREKWRAFILRSEPKQRINNKALPVWRITRGVEAIFYSLVPVSYSVTVFYWGWPEWILWSLVSVFILITLVSVVFFPKIYWNRWRYEVLEHEIDLQYGVFFVKRTLIPMTRVQHVDTKQGPLLRKYGLATVTISTAATIHEIPALSNDVADDLRDRIAKLARVTDDE